MLYPKYNRPICLLVLTGLGIAFTVIGAAWRQLNKPPSQPKPSPVASSEVIAPPTQVAPTPTANAAQRYILWGYTYNPNQKPAVDSWSKFASGQVYVLVDDTDQQTCVGRVINLKITLIHDDPNICL